MPPKANPKNQNEEIPEEATQTLAEFNQTLSNFLYDAWFLRSQESPLYLLFNHIYSTECTTLYYPGQPRISIGVCPQPLFGTPGPVATRENSKLTKKNDKSLPPHQRPDSARFLLYSDRGNDAKLPKGITSARVLICFHENKTLNIPDAWWTAEARQAADAKIAANLPQVYDTVMAAFAHHPDWKRVHAVLLIGPFFTHLAWNSRPTDQQLAPVQPNPLPKDPKKAKGKAYKIIIDKLLQEISQYKDRRLPDEIYYYNQPVVEYHDLQEGEEYQDVRLSPQFLWTLASPVTKYYPQIKQRSSMFAPPSVKPRISVGQAVAWEAVKQAIITKPIKDVNSKLRFLGHGPGSESTPTPPASKGDCYKPSGSTKPALSQPPMKTRARKEGELPGIE
ncbi:hypothetical protein L226DRAFT_563534 [Lentinus tigrinus ALCF2SS1-7]|uniref:Uncharacterized protein n=1 Tax=Lentinus tigrinus ALCF2SS1-6 TaxID=1328759 RepID=A0A5C2RSD6_9APHY|nr:hypothetical protein L227DRAFT_567403 [Lentinus tigrinus ALCF2SS1-6]RPD69216.1 hypothetical protein L226DRAFT_563534 [Lentinus tigrinus ALCF2SS1-7]